MICIFLFIQFTDSISYYEKIIKNDPFNLEAYKKLSSFYIKEKRYTDAINCYNEILNIKPQDKESRYGIGVAYYMNGNYVMAKKIFKEIIEEEPTYIAYFNLAVVLEKEKKYYDAIDMLNKAVEIYPDDILSLLHLGGIYLILRRYYDAIEVYTKIIEIAQNEYRAYEGRAIAYWKTNNEYNAVQDLKKAKELKSGIYLGIVEPPSYERISPISIVERDTTHILPPEDPNVLSYVADIYTSTGDYEAAIEVYTKIIKILRFNPKYYELRAKMYLKIGEKDKAKADLEKAKELRSKKK